MALTTSMAATAKQEFMMGGHCFNAPVTPTITATNGTGLATSVSSIIGIAVGMAVTGTGITGTSYVSQITSGTTFSFFPVNTSAISAGTVTISGDVFKISLISSGATTWNTANSAMINAGVPGTGSPTTTNIGTDETGASGTYVAGGQVLATNTSALLGGSVPQTAYVTWSVNPSWTGATLSAMGCAIYNNSVRVGGATNFGGGRILGVFDFGGTQSVTAGTFTVLLPTSAYNTAILRIS